ncbi:YbhB/YbcL family Raf kinase inhibitor-like protein [Mesoaciditoga lauensis]|uniref:YbhB/YbcL family Raf kinase inhibitor-like protein n=1 Tax=Mesoaciditoga lauensis TaxID=1495039 RepID=UPI00056BB095|nr:YbhB/YbcL family Raf kinase inhibitor-like protein [Mesoaciditoga lauensis]
MEIKSVFEHMGFIPKKYTCDGEDINPPLEIKSLPQSTESLAIIVDDPDAPMGTFVHWVAWNIQPTGKIEENTMETFARGRNDFGRNSYNGPCPPRGHGIHHYHFKLYALDSFLNLKNGASKKQLEKEMKNHILSSTELIGLYQR